MEKYIDWYYLFDAGCFLGLAVCAVGLAVCAKGLGNLSDYKITKKYLSRGLFTVGLCEAIACLGVAGNNGWKAYDTARYQQRYSIVLNDTKKYRACNGQEMTAFYGKGDGKIWQLSSPYNKDLRVNRGDTLDVLAYTDKKGRVYCYPDLVVEQIKHKQK